MGIKLIIADDHPIVRRGLVFFLKTQSDIRVIGEASSGNEIIQLADELQPDLILMDLLMPGLNGIEATKKIKAKNPYIRIIILTSFSDQDQVIPAIEAGADGYQLKDVEPDVLVQAIREVVNGGKSLHPKATDQIVSQFTKKRKEDAKIDELTTREKEVLIEIAKGKSNKEIATSLYITEKTVKTHVSNILAKLELSDRTQAALFAVRNGLVQNQ
ncbi:LuxR family two component transcriptional regulator [Bacillus oleivorans]|uniref:LuxR family two component transcriptional regulator n=1 Tax=Bacillus oleivorans TaxID=1448271 RepID=A0A285CSC4_9BACI|nr:response regulator transcription factor [Bacillus oleivorans]SNX69946.1 LuxR family two component transcriptional regulator [Bacillus oleivorans]